ncbi:hypothetical protein ACWEOI_12725 [Nocardia sp. NPDC004340]
MICIKHRIWLGATQRDIGDYPPALRAERRFRTRLTRRHVLYNSFVMDFARRSVNADVLGCSETIARRTATGVTDLGALLYPEHVAIAQLLTSHWFLAATTDPACSKHNREVRVRAALTSILPTVRDGALSLAARRITALTAHLAKCRSDAAALGIPPVDPGFHMLHNLALDPISTVSAEQRPSPIHAPR